MTPTAADSAITPFTVAIPVEQQRELRRRLEATRFPSPLPDDTWATGMPVAEQRRLVEAWAAFDWEQFEARLAGVPQFTTVIEGQRIHFMHVRSAVDGATPLLLTHGWPGSFLEFLDVIGPLTDPEAHGGRVEDAFHVVIPSIPGFAFSTPLVESGWTTRRIAEAWAELMTRLSYDRFGVQGGDLGAGISPEVGRVAPDRVIGVHVNGAIDFAGATDPSTLGELSQLEQERMRRIGRFMEEEFAYISLQSTRPGVLGAMVSDSPLALLAWLGDKYRVWTHPADAAPDEVLGELFFAHLGLYWFTECAGSAACVGYAQDDGTWGSVPEDSGVPTASIQFAHDVGIRGVDEAGSTIVRWTDVPETGGHFAAMEEPGLLVADLREFFASVRAGY